MANVLIVYATDYGNTRKMAEAIASGAMSVPDTQVSLKLAEDVTTDDLIASDALIVGTPVHMGSPDWRVKKFIDTVCSRLWMKDSMVGKVGAIFATGSGYGNAGGGSELTMLALLNNLAELGMVLVPLPKNTPGYYLAGLQWGPYGRSAGEKMEQTGVTDERLEAATYHGANVSRIASVLKGHDLFAKPIPVLA
ncbi:flavodoxin domain-containing protein [Scytonema sp. PCC 10023]|uniref:flavodoxin domain-containing protein n=1 Tax=Scytonema sp. PCC 10023 TaxID=1680591 RepID=UPI0039C64DD8